MGVPFTEVAKDAGIVRADAGVENAFCCHGVSAVSDSSSARVGNNTNFSDMWPSFGVVPKQ
ncbi:hypothetical protein RS81_00404 [Microbacterium terrae]|uniref:Uncharacterized protein n=1 Tax=Microbacterium terrae TaxID=69369 RepID=A0A0M2HKL8_9MICO|nr:hypothetical protein RS81_00404 [Microbacterium terrae]